MKRLSQPGVWNAVGLYFGLIFLCLFWPLVELFDRMGQAAKRALKACALGPRRWFARDARYRRSLSEEGGCHD